MANKKKREVKDNILDWFRNEFVPNASDATLAALIFLYNKYSEDLYTESAQEFIKQEKERLLKIPVNRKS